jgi:hypothetical protein
MKTLKSIILCGSLFLTACSTPYTLPVGVETAKVKVADISWICDGGNIKTLKPNEKGYADIPAGNRITLGVNYFADGGNVTYRCSPRVNFIPQAKSSYYQDFQIEAEKCTAFIYKEVLTNPVGLDFDPTLTPGGACSNK